MIPRYPIMHGLRVFTRADDFASGSLVAPPTMTPVTMAAVPHGAVLAYSTWDLTANLQRFLVTRVVEQVAGGTVEFSEPCSVTSLPDGNVAIAAGVRVAAYDSALHGPLWSVDVEAGALGLRLASRSSDSIWVAWWTALNGEANTWLAAIDASGYIMQPINLGVGMWPVISSSAAGVAIAWDGHVMTGPYCMDPVRGWVRDPSGNVTFDAQVTGSGLYAYDVLWRGSTPLLFAASSVSYNDLPLATIWGMCNIASSFILTGEGAIEWQAPH